MFWLWLSSYIFYLHINRQPSSLAHNLCSKSPPCIFRVLGTITVNRLHWVHPTDTVDQPDSQEIASSYQFSTKIGVTMSLFSECGCQKESSHARLAIPAFRSDYIICHSQPSVWHDLQFQCLKHPPSIVLSTYDTGHPVTVLNTYTQRDFRSIP